MSLPLGASAGVGARSNLSILSTNWIFLQRKPHSSEQTGRQERVDGGMTTETQDSLQSAKHTTRSYVNPIQLLEPDLIYHAASFSCRC